jgi:hypothetical protein
MAEKLCLTQQTVEDISGKKRRQGIKNVREEPKLVRKHPHIVSVLSFSLHPFSVEFPFLSFDTQ